MLCISFEGELENVFDLLQGQITADLKKLENTDFILSCLCNEKGYILCDFLVTLSKKNNFQIMIKKSLSNAFESEILKFLPFYNLSIVKKQIELGFVFNNSSLLKNRIVSNNEFGLAVTRKEGRFETLDEKQAQINLSLMSFFNFTNAASKKRPHDVGFNKTHVSFDKGCFRGQEIIARTNYLSKSSKQIFPIFLDFDKFLDPKYKELQRNQVDDGYILLVSEKIN